MTEPASGYEVFLDASYYDLWAARKIAVWSFCETLHFETRDDAVAWTYAPNDPNTRAREISNL